MNINILLIVLGCGVCLTLAQQQQQSQCRTTFINNLYQCVSNSSMEVTSFLWMVTNSSSGTAPSNMEQFKETACSKQEEVTNCGIRFMQKLMNSTICNPSKDKDERMAIDTNFRAIFGQLDMLCAHPCRATLISDIRDCYQVAELDPELFLSNATMGRGAVIGTTDKDVAQYCAHKDTLASCMKEKRDACPEAPAILRAIGLDIESMEKGVSILCKHPKVYLEGVECFEEPTAGVEKCQQEQNQNMINLMMSAQQTNMEEAMFFDNFCKIRANHVKCDLSEWGKKEHKSCTKAVIGLRTEMECGLMPNQCSSIQKQELKDVCHVDAYNLDDRDSSASRNQCFLGLALLFPFIYKLLVL